MEASPRFDLSLDGLEKAEITNYLLSQKNECRSLSFPDEVAAGINAQENKEQQGEAPQ